MPLRVRKRKVKPSKRLALNLPKLIGFPPFNAGRDIFQREGCGQTHGARFREMDVRLRKRLTAKTAKAIGFPHFNTGREHLPVKSGADKLVSLKFHEMNVKPSKKAWR